MKVLEVIETYQRIVKLIRQKKTGNSFEFAKKIGISRSHLFNYLTELRLMGFEIHYDKSLQSYYQTNNCRLDCSFHIHEEEEE